MTSAADALIGTPDASASKAVHASVGMSQLQDPQSAYFAVSNLNAYYGDSFIVQDVSFDMNEGEIVALLGRNGAGKTSLILAALGLVDSTGTLRIDGQDPRTLAPKERAALCS